MQTMRSTNKNICIESIRIAFIGLGERGLTALRLMLPVEGAEVAVLCDLRKEHVEAAAQLLEAQGRKRPVCVHGAEAYKQACAQTDVDLAYICSDWSSHPVIALEAMRHGKHVAIEVPAATTMTEIQELVDTARQTSRQCFLLENACFEEQLMDAVAAIRRGEIGEVVHAEGNYYHCLDDRWAPWRLEANRLRRGDLYPTHELGPICQALDIGHTDHLQTLVCMDSAALTGPEVYKELATLIRTRRGRTILLRHDVLTKQPYDRRFLFIGTRGRIELSDTGHPSHEQMTRTMNQRLIRALTTGEPFGIDLQDLASWCAVIPLSEESIRRGFAPLPFPDFSGL